jgi:protein-S-isoprenylcysteine O-methyltransferase Ste14
MQPPTPVERPHISRPGVATCFGAISSPALYRNFVIHLSVMIPATVLMCWFAKKIDQLAGWSWPIAVPPSIALGGASFTAGALWVWYVYGYLYLAGGGSPGTHVDGGPARMVDSGPYAFVRHPSVLGKLAGVVGLGVAWQSPVFCVVFIPVLLVYSLLTNRFLQERYCEIRYGPDYRHYRSVVPMILPLPSGLARWRSGVGVLASQEAGSTLIERNVPLGVWAEIRWYLLGLAVLVALSAGGWLLLSAGI